MAKFTKEAIIASFKKLLNDKPLDQITVKDIIENCGVNRKTFYYYYHDIYNLVEELFESEIERIQAEFSSEEHTWQEAQKAIMQYMMDNRKTTLHIYLSANRANLEKQIRNISIEHLTALLRGLCHDVNVEDEDILLIANIYDSAISGMLLRWIEDGMKEIPDGLIDRISALMDGTVQLSIKNAERLMQEDHKR